ncbi:MAG TPA: hypothetical protein PKK68_09160 [Methanothrix soehngenii]|nr:hypothetical protein [Methanothrix soehngenii]
MSMLMPIGIIMASGAVGGIVNALVSDNGFVSPSEETTGEITIIRPGFAGNILLGAVAAFISWGLYGAFSNAVIWGANSGMGTEEITVSISSIAGAVLVGIGGARWLTNEVDKKLLKTAAITAAAANASFDDSRKIARATPAQAFNIAKKMYKQ